MKRFRSKPSISLFACAACALGLLLWARLLLVSSPPRIATAEPAPALPQGLTVSAPRTDAKPVQPAETPDAEKAAAPAHSDH
ncbi:MAG: hypothetical protein QM783_06670 [Phycisphaerales bacterium]